MFSLVTCLFSFFLQAVRCARKMHTVSSLLNPEPPILDVFMQASGDFSRLLIIFVNSLDPDQDRPNVGPDLDPNYLTLWWCS